MTRLPCEVFKKSGKPEFHYLYLLKATATRYEKWFNKYMNQIPVAILFCLLTTISSAQTEEPQMNIYPNPFADSITYTITANYGDSVAFNLFDVQGKLKSSHKKQPFYQSQVIYLTTDALNDGIYYTSVSIDSSVYNNKIIKNGGGSMVKLALDININSLLSKELFTEALLIYPNPTNAETKISLETHDKKAIISLQNMEGKKLFEQEVENKAGIIECTFNVSLLENGIYFIRYKSENSEFSNKIVKSN